MTYKKGVSMFLGLIGPKSSAILYLCKFGDSDTGFKRGVRLELSESRLNMALDQLLSGKIPH